MGNATTDPWAGMTAGSSGNYWKWNAVGESLVGTVTAKRAGTDYDGNPCPEMDIDPDDGETVTITVEQAMLKREILEINPQVGDRIAITFKKIDKTGKGGKLYVFDVATKAGDGDDPAPAAAAAKPDASALL